MKLHVIKVLDYRGEGYVYQILKGLEWLKQHYIHKKLELLISLWGYCWRGDKKKINY